MPRPDKVAAVAEIKERIEAAKAVFLAEYAGLSVKQQQELRRGLKEQGAEFKVVKMTLARRAVEELDIDAFEGLLLGPTGIAFADEDAVSAAKVLKDFSKSYEVFSVKGGLLGEDALTPERISELADIEPREVLLAKLAGAMKAPLTNMAGLLAALPQGAASMFQQLIDKKVAAGDTGEAPEEPAVAEDTAEADAEPQPEAAETDATEAAATSEAEAGDEADAAEDSDVTEEEPEENEPEAEASADQDEPEADDEPAAEEE